MKDKKVLYILLFLYTALPLVGWLIGSFSDQRSESQGFGASGGIGAFMGVFTGFFAAFLGSIFGSFVQLLSRNKNVVVGYFIPPAVIFTIVIADAMS